MAKKIYFGTNLKMYKGNGDTVAYLSALAARAESLESAHDIELFVIPSYPALKEAVETVNRQTGKRRIIIGAQNMSPHDCGQYTGEVSPLMLQELGVGLVMIGHSERRHGMRETDEEENAKVLAALNHRFITLLCIGETSAQKNYGIADEVLRSQLKIGLHGVGADRLPLLRIAYEPVWAIGEEGVPASADYAAQRHHVIKQCLLELFGDQAEQIPLFYGGSVNPDNAEELISRPHIDGLFIGRSAWQADKFDALIRRVLPKI